MTHREAWEEKSFQVFTDEDGVLRSGYYPTNASGPVSGGVQVDYVWGNFPMQPDDDRVDYGQDIIANVIEADEKSGKQRFTIDMPPAQVPLIAGNVFTVSGHDGDLNGVYTVDSVVVNTVNTSTYIKTTASFIANDPTPQALFSFLPANNFGGGSGDLSWSRTTKRAAEKLNSALDNHIIATEGWSNFPGYIPNYSGDEDSGLETVVPDVLRMTIGDAEDALTKANLNYRLQRHNPTIFGLESTGTTVRVFAYDTQAAGAGGAQDYLVGLKVGDKVFPDNNEYSFDGPVTVTKVNEDGENSWFEFETAEPVNVDTSADGTVWPDNTLLNLVTVMRYWNQPGDIKDEGTNIYLRAFGD